MNSPTTALFDKGRTVFGLHLARKPMRETNEAIVVEGNLDVIAAHQAGFSNVVSSQGTALTEHQLRLIKKHAKRILLALDADEAGDKATLRGLSVAREALEREDEVGFDPHGLIKQEARLGVDIRVMTLPDGEDPDDVINRDPDEWTRRAAEAEPVVEYVMRVVARGKDLEDAKVKVEVANAVIPYIEDVADAIERDAYRQKLARLLKVDVSVLARRGGAPLVGARARCCASPTTCIGSTGPLKTSGLVNFQPTISLTPSCNWSSLSLPMRSPRSRRICRPLSARTLPNPCSRPWRA
jgi:DNA primase